MSSVLDFILSEWEAGDYDDDMAEAYSNFLLHLLDATEEERRDPRVIRFLEAGYEAYALENEGFDSQAEVTRDIALAMVGGAKRAVSPSPRPVTPPAAPGSPCAPPPNGLWRPWTPSPRAKRSHSPEPEPVPEPEVVGQPEIEILQSRERELKRFRTKFREEVALVKGLGGTLPTEDVMVDMFDAMLARQRDSLKAKDDDRVILEIENGESADNPLWFSMRRVDQLNGRVILDKLARVLNSNQNFLVEGKLKFSYIHIPTPDAGGRRKNKVANESIDQWLKRKVESKSIFSPSNEHDQMCLTRSIVVAKGKDGLHVRTFSRLRQPNSIPQRKESLKLCESAGIDPNHPCGLDEVRKVQAVLPDYRLCVFTDKKGKECVFKGDYAAGRKNIYLMLHEGHFSAILYPCQAFEYEFHCEQCVVFYNNKGDHRCEGTCWRCLGPNPHDDANVALRRCDDCGHQFRGDECFNIHSTLKLLNSEKTKCETFRFCLSCEKSYSTLSRVVHVCGFVWCKFCKSNVRENHLCYMSRWNGKEKKDKWHYLTCYYDIETTQSDEVEGSPGTFEHKPNLLVCQTVCDQCHQIPQNDYFCTVCKNRQHVFHSLDDPNLNVMGQFLDYLQSFPAKTELLIVAHNSKSFDGIFVLQEMISRRLKPELVLQGAKIICMTVGHWKFIDSLMFLPMPLSNMPKSFGLKELKKGYWPFLANKADFYNYEGPLLDRELYCISSMKSNAFAEFNQWYNDQIAARVVFNFRKELIEYCISDVTILRQSCEAFRKLFAESAGFDPMFQCITLSSACMAAYRRNFLPENKIAIVPPGGYHGRGKQSHKALRWLDFESHKLGLKIRTVYTDREVSVLGRPVDGYVEIPKPDGSLERRIYQFHGDYWHQCPLHFPANGDTLENRFELTKRLTSLFQKAGYTVVEKWECVFDRELLENPEVKAYFKANPTTRCPPLQLREALCGGRTSALRWYHKANVAAGEKIKMVDVISEYPNANLRGQYPYGHPTIYLEGDPEMPPAERWNGLIKCTVLPPRDLFLPVLPLKCNGKLMFPLCRTCAETESKELCQHNPAERQLTSSWCAPELILAISEKGYTLVKIHEVYQYPGTMQYDPKTGEDGLLSGYVRRFMALKIQASGWPLECTTAEQQEKYIADVKKHDGIIIDPSKVEKNPALRTLSKLILNSFWGKFGEKTLRPTTQLVYDYADLMKIVTDPSKEVNGLVPLGEDCLQVSYKPVEDSEESLPTSSLLHAAWTTCLGRLKLYSYLDMVKERALYHDTDSVAYISRPGEIDLPLGSHLGDLTDQVEEEYGSGSYIVEFAAGGPKNYGYKVAVGGDLSNIKTCIKVRGITINRSCSDMVTFENLKAMVMGEVDNMSIPIPHQIIRKPGWKIVTMATSKNWQAANTKRRRLDVARTVPHGFNAWGDEDPEDQDVLEAMELCVDS